jgi:hypothetical protein
VKKFSRVCPWCNQSVPEGPGHGVCHGSLGFVVHQGECNEWVSSLYRDYSRSKKGRWRSYNRIRALLRQRREMLRR